MHVIATAGHVDHGKSTLIRLLTGTEPDRWPEERRRGLTIDLGFASTTIEAGLLAFVDVPGHGRFVPNMLAGVGPVPAVLFVVAADEGWMPQSREHLQALDALGVGHGVLAITRCDLAEPAPAIEQTRHETANTTLADMPVVEVSGVTGDGIDQLRTALTKLARQLPPADPRPAPRLWMDRAFPVRGAGTVVTGTLSAGMLRVDQRLTTHPNGRPVTVRGLECLGTKHQEVRAVARVAVNLREIGHEQLHRGDALLAPGAWLSTDLLDVRLRGPSPEELPHQLMLHVGSAAIPSRLRPLGQDTARISLREPLPLRIGDRALLREPGAHRIAGALILDVRPPKLRRRGAAKRRARQLATMDGSADGVAELARRHLVRADELAAMGASAPSIPDGDWLADPSFMDDRATRLREILRHYREQYPLADGMPAQAARRALELPESALLHAVLRTPTAEGITLHAGHLRLGGAEASTTLPDTVLGKVRAVQEHLRATPFRAPTADELIEHGLSEKELAAAERAGELRRIGPSLVLLPDFVPAARARLAQLPSPFTPSQARRSLDTTRRVVVPLLELLAREGHTERLPDGTHRLTE